MENKKREKSNIVAFPNLYERLIEKGLDRLAAKDFKSAADLFSEAKEMGPDHPDLNIGLVVSLVELGRYSEARELCEEVLQKGIGDYFQVVNIYLMVLLQLNEHEKMTAVIEALLEEGHVPPEKEEHFRTMLEFSRRALEDKPADKEEADQESDQLFPDLSEPALLEIISKLPRLNIRPHIEEIAALLKNEEIHPFIKTLLLNVLQEQGVTEEVAVRKLGLEKTVSPAALELPNGTAFFKGTVSLLEDSLAHTDPSLYSMASGLLERDYFILYPFDPDESEYAVWAAACHMLAVRYLNGEADAADIAEIYGADTEAVDSKAAFLEGIEELSSPII